jgi:hypothetical protein
VLETEWGGTPDGPVGLDVTKTIEIFNRVADSVVVETKPLCQFGSVDRIASLVGVVVILFPF